MKILAIRAIIPTHTLGQRNGMKRVIAAGISAVNKISSFPVSEGAASGSFV